MKKYYNKRLFRSIKIRLVNYYYLLFPSTVVFIDDLIYPQRNDINLRVDFIKNYILEPSNKVENSDYYKFLVNLKKHPYYIKDIEIEKLIKNFFNLYFSIKKNGYQPDKYGHITIEKVNSKMKFVYPNNGGLSFGVEVNNKYILIEGAHRLAVLKAINYSKVKCKRIYRARSTSSDYSSFIKNYQND
jgi:hypothetical protein